jgi:hypothetical protein
MEVVSGARKDSCAVSVKGGGLAVDRCWFQGFDKTITFQAYSRTFAQIRQTLIVPGGGGSVPPQSSANEMYGWGVEAQVEGGRSPEKGKPHGLLLEHCTMEGAGLLDLISGASSSPFPVEIKHCAVRADALLACSLDKSLATQVSWQGQGNQYEILGRTWVVLSARQGTPALSTHATDLASWSAIAKENNPVPGKLEFMTDPPARSNPPRPRDFAIIAPGAPATKPGADPERVGPWGR